ncbi:hypothetical protein [[Mycoplasma] testudinis]|uniref:hypothetical protein n=1 Tax=[Mycoplasma] testudinis TaxID=33924 RepID=UPI0004816E0A|nr:hypothetical protein [[Mycoplasma] testudinis]
MKNYNVHEPAKHLLILLSKFGSLTLAQLATLDDTSLTAVHLKTNRLINKKLIFSRKSKHSKLLLFAISNKGLSYIEQPKGVASNFYWQNINHNDGVINVIKMLGLKTGEYLTDKEIRAKRSNKHEHLPDLMILKLVKHDGYVFTEKTAFEIELTYKYPKSVYNKIFKYFNQALDDGQYDQVVYLCSDQVHERLLKLQKAIYFHNKIYLLNLTAFLKNQDFVGLKTAQVEPAKPKALNNEVLNEATVLGLNDSHSFDLKPSKAQLQVETDNVSNDDEMLSESEKKRLWALYLEQKTEEEWEVFEDDGSLLTENEKKCLWEEYKKNKSHSVQE